MLLTRILTGFGEIFLTFFFRNIILASTTAGAELWINSANGPPFKYFRWYRKWGPEHSCQEYIKEFFSEITVRDDGEAGIVWTNYAHSDEAGHKYVHKVEVRFVFINKILHKRFYSSFDQNFNNFECFCFVSISNPFEIEVWIQKEKKTPHSFLDFIVTYMFFCHF